MKKLLTLLLAALTVISVKAQDKKDIIKTVCHHKSITYAFFFSLSISSFISFETDASRIFR